MYGWKKGEGETLAACYRRYWFILDLSRWIFLFELRYFLWTFLVLETLKRGTLQTPCIKSNLDGW